MSGEQLSGLEPFNGLNEAKKQAVTDSINKREQIMLTCMQAILSNPNTKFPDDAKTLENHVKRVVGLSTAYCNEIIRRFST